MCNYWDGKQCITEMLNASIVGWRDNEWVGRYFEYLLRKLLRDYVSHAGDLIIGNTNFDAFSNGLIDYKVVSYDPKRKNSVSLNDYDSMIKGVQDFKSIYYIIALGTSVTSLSFNSWQDDLKIKVDGKLSTYSEKNRELGVKSKVRKQSFTVDKIIIFEFNRSSMLKCKQTQDGWKNSNGSPRNMKFQLPLDDPEIQQYITELVVFC